jgi:hypothetical protein
VVRKLLDDCDALDGLRDGMINNPAACHFTPSVLICGSAAATDCLPRAKVEALEAAFSGPRDSSGRPLYASFPYDTGMAQPGWRIWMLGFDGAMPALNVALGAQALSLYFMTPQQPNRSPFALDADHAERDVAQTAAINDATSTFLTSFAGHGGKLLIYQGQSDPVFSADDIRAWYGRLAQSDPAAATYARLFIAPGMTHCNGGMATDRFDTLAALQDWVENNVAPDAIVATGKALPGVSRPLCAYPAYARYRDGDPSKAESFVCTAPGRPQ